MDFARFAWLNLLGLGIIKDVHVVRQVKNSSPPTQLGLVVFAFDYRSTVAILVCMPFIAVQRFVWRRAYRDAHGVWFWNGGIILLLFDESVLSGYDRLVDG